MLFNGTCSDVVRLEKAHSSQWAFSYYMSFNLSRCSRSTLDRLCNTAFIPPLKALRDTFALPSAVCAPVL
jgi:hypothetical protein